jgi:hypothetical protein
MCAQGREASLPACCKARGAHCGRSTETTSNAAARRQTSFPYGFGRTILEYVVASLANDHGIGRGSRLVSKIVQPNAALAGT